MHLPNHLSGRLIGVALAIAVPVAVAACSSTHPATVIRATVPGTTPRSADTNGASPSTAAGAPTAAAGQVAAPAGFQPTSASFVSPTSGFVLGAVGCQPDEDCAAQLVATADGGAHWRLLAAPDVSLLNTAGDLLGQASSVHGVVFANQQDGWLYGPGLWSTSDGGARWQQINLGGAIVPSQGGGVVAMAASAGTVYAVVSPDPFDAEPDQLFSSPVGQDAWAQVGSMTAGQAILAVSGRAAWFAGSNVGAGGSTEVWTTADGVHWHQIAFSCPGVDYGLAGIAAASPSQVLFLCAGDGAAGSMTKEVLSSSDGGTTVQLAGQAPFQGDPYGIAVPPGQDSLITVAAASGASFLDRSADGGATWAELPYNTGGAAWSSLSYVSPTIGWVVLGSPATGNSQLLRTSDAGATWHPVGF